MWKWIILYMGHIRHLRVCLQDTLVEQNIFGSYIHNFDIFSHYHPSKSRGHSHKNAWELLFPHTLEVGSKIRDVPLLPTQQQFSKDYPVIIQLFALYLYEKWVCMYYCRGFAWVHAGIEKWFTFLKGISLIINITGLTFDKVQFGTT